jgi:hypothetical protein
MVHTVALHELTAYKLVRSISGISSAQPGC